MSTPNPYITAADVVSKLGNQLYDLLDVECTFALYQTEQQLFFRWYKRAFPVEFPLGQLYSNTSYPRGYNLNRRPGMTGHTYQNYGFDPVSGDRAIVSDAGTGTGPALQFPVAIAVEASGDLVVVDRNLQALVRVDPATGDRTILSDGGNGVAVEASGDLVVVDATLQAVFRVDPVSGNRIIISDAGTGAGPNFSVPAGIAVGRTRSSRLRSSCRLRR